MRKLTLASWGLWAFIAMCAQAEDAAAPVNETPDAAAPAENNVAVTEADSVKSGETLDDGDDVVSDAATRRKSADKKMAKAGKGAAKGKGKGKKDNTIRGEGKLDSGADREEGWVIRKAADGTYVKVPAKQTFRFEGDVSGQANRPSQSVLGQRPSYRPSTLIPERMSFRKEFLESAGTGR